MTLVSVLCVDMCSDKCTQRLTVRAMKAMSTHGRICPGYLVDACTTGNAHLWLSTLKNIRIQGRVMEGRLTVGAMKAVSTAW